MMKKSCLIYLLANLACGFHASDAMNMDYTVQLAKQNNLTIGAHPGYQDLVGFGRRSMNCSVKEIENIVLYQLGALHSFCLKHETKISYVKPHGALYNDMMKDVDIFKAILSAVKTFNSELKLMILSSLKNEQYSSIANEFGIELLYEAFMDRNYNADGSLVSRDLPNAVIHDVQSVIKRIEILKQSGYIQSIQGEKLFLQVDTLCVHGDNDSALDFILALKEALN